MAATLSIVCASAQAQAILNRSDASRAREQFTEPPAPLSQPPAPTIRLQGSEPPPQAGSIQLSIARIVVEGSTAYPASELEALGAALIGKRSSLADVYALTDRITAKYGADGYVFSRAIVPPQALQQHNATIRIRVVEGYVDKVEWPDAVKRYRDVFSYYTEQIKASRPINSRVLERYMLLANDLPGLSFRGTLKASETMPGAATLVIEVTEKVLAADARLDNRGSHSSGPGRISATFGINNAFGQHESASLTYAGSIDFKELRYIAGEFRTLLTPEGLTLFVSPYYSAGRPGMRIFRDLDYKTWAAGVDAGVSYPVIRSREQNLALSAFAFVTEAGSDLLFGRFSEDRLRGFRVRAAYDAYDSLGGISQVIVTGSQGLEGLGSTSNDNLLASRTQGRVDFTKVEAFISRTQPLGMNVSLYGAFEGQWASAPLLSSEQCSYGGARIGRAYDPSALVGDSCWAVLGELRYDIPVSIPDLTQSQAYLFADHGQTYLRDASLLTPAHQEGSSFGAGLRLAWKSSLTASVEVARQIEGPDGQGWRGFFSVGATY